MSINKYLLGKMFLCQNQWVQAKRIFLLSFQRLRGVEKEEWEETCIKVITVVVSPLTSLMSEQSQPLEKWL